VAYVLLQYLPGAKIGTNTALLAVFFMNSDLKLLCHFESLSPFVLSILLISLLSYGLFLLESTSFLSKNLLILLFLFLELFYGYFEKRKKLPQKKLPSAVFSKIKRLNTRNFIIYSVITGGMVTRR